MTRPRLDKWFSLRRTRVTGIAVEAPGVAGRQHDGGSGRTVVIFCASARPSITLGSTTSVKTDRHVPLEHVHAGGGGFRFDRLVAEFRQQGDRNASHVAVVLDDQDGFLPSRRCGALGSVGGARGRPRLRGR